MRAIKKNFNVNPKLEIFTLQMLRCPMNWDLQGRSIGIALQVWAALGLYGDLSSRDSGVADIFCFVLSDEF